MSRLLNEDDVLTVILYSKLFDDAKCGKVKEALCKIPTAKAVPIDVLREIRSEIENKRIEKPGGHWQLGIALDIIDKHLKAESEG